MKNLLKAALLCLLAFPAAAQDADDEQPIITLHSDAYAEIGETNRFSFLIGSTEPTYIDIDLGAGKNEVAIDVVSIDPETGDYLGTWIPARVNADGTIKIYGDASKIDVIVMDGAYITDIDMTACSNLEILSLEHNALRSLDLTPFTKLMAIYLTDNPFTAETPLKIGVPKPDLQILEIDIIDHLDQSFNISDYPAMVSFDAYHNLDLHKLDPSGCPNLRALSLEMTDIESVDVSNNLNLTNLNIAETRITDIDLSKNTQLRYFIASHSSGTINTGVKLNSIDLSHNPYLMFLSLTGNDLTSIDLSKNTYLQTLLLNRNKLTSIDLSNNPNLYSVNLMLNDMDFATLPLQESTWSEYYYLQNAMPVSRELAVGAPLDMSARVLRNGTETTARVMRKPFTGDAVELDASLYTYADGVVTFNSAVSDSVYVEYSNSALNEYRMTTSLFRVKNADEIGLPSKVIALNLDYSVRDFNLCIGVNGASEQNPRKVLVDFGSDTKTELTTTTSAFDPSKAISFTAPADFNGRINIWMPEGEDISAFGIDGVTIYNIDIKNATSLRELSVTGASLYSIDMRYNRNLTYLDLSDNQLSSLSLLGIYGDYEKNVIATVKAANNRISTIELRDGSSIRRLDLSGNLLTELPITEFDYATSINLSNNRLSGEFSLAYQAGATDINLSGNPISALKLDKFTNLQHFDVSNTLLNLATLPLPEELGAKEYIYAPLLDLSIQDKAPAVNLTAQNRMVNGRGTDFVWKKADGTVLVQGVDIDCVDGGTRFLNEELGQVYCEMTNPAFPGLTLSTTRVEVVGAPTIVVGTFTTPSAANGELIIVGNKNSALYVDWRGDGTEFTEYPFTGTSISSYAIKTVAGAEAKIYTYGSPEDVTVFSVYSVPMSSLDLTPMTALTALSIGGAGLTPDRMNMPDARLTELNLIGNSFSTYPYFEKYPLLTSLNLSQNLLTEFDASPLARLTSLYLSNNKLTDIKFNNPALWNIQLNGNRFESIDLSGLTAAEQIILNNNLLESIDLSPVKSTLLALTIVGNRFTFATLPRPEDAPKMSTMYYGLQAPVEVECVNGKVDLSSQAMVGDVATTYTWYYGDATLDASTGEYIGETLIEDDEYSIVDGVTTFHTTFNEKVMCVMSNEAYPNLLLTSSRLNVDESAINEIEAPAATTPAGCYDLLGRRVSSPAKNGIYIIDGRKVMIR